MAKVRTTLNLDEEVVLLWQEIAHREGASLSSCVNGWLRQVYPAADALASVIDEDRQATQARLAHISSAVQAANEIYANAAQVARAVHPSPGRKRAGGGRTEARGQSADRPTPPSCNTGGKLPKRGGRA